MSWEGWVRPEWVVKPGRSVHPPITHVGPHIPPSASHSKRHFLHLLSWQPRAVIFSLEGFSLEALARDSPFHILVHKGSQKPGDSHKAFHKDVRRASLVDIANRGQSRPYALLDLCHNPCPSQILCQIPCLFRILFQSHVHNQGLDLDTQIPGRHILHNNLCLFLSWGLRPRVLFCLLLASKSPPFLFWIAYKNCRCYLVSISFIGISRKVHKIQYCVLKP